MSISRIASYCDIKYFLGGNIDIQRKIKRQDKKITILIPYSVFLPERSLLINLEIILLVDSIKVFLKISHCPFGSFGIKFPRVLSGNGPFTWEFKYTLHLTPSAPFL